MSTRIPRGGAEGRGDAPLAGMNRDAILGSLFILIAVVGVPLAAGALRVVHGGRVPGSFERLLGPLREINDERGLANVEARAPSIRAAAAESGVPSLLLGALMFSESRGRSGQKSSAGALGLLQLMPGAARDAARRLGVTLAEDPEALEETLLADEDLNIRLGAAHLRWLLDHQGDWTLEAVLVSYNAGRARLFGWIGDHGSYEGWVRSEEMARAEGRPTTGALAYAREVLLARSALEERGTL